MRKSTLFISAALTTFILVVMFGVVSAYQTIVKSSAQALAAPFQPTAVQMASMPPAAPADVAPISPQDAAALAAQVINRTDLFSAEITQFNGVDVYLVTFSSGDLVYVGFDGRILSMAKTPLTVVSQSLSTNNSVNNGNPSNNPPASNPSNNGESEQEGGDD
jgi:hypothetical protein